MILTLEVFRGRNFVCFWNESPCSFKHSALKLCIRVVVALFLVLLLWVGSYLDRVEVADWILGSMKEACACKAQVSCMFVNCFLLFLLLVFSEFASKLLAVLYVVVRFVRF